MAKRPYRVTKEVQWRKAIEGQASSGLTARAYCREQGLSEASFYGWRRKIRQQAGGVESIGPPAFVPAVVTGTSLGESPIVLELASGMVLKLPESICVTRLAELVHILQSRGER